MTLTGKTITLKVEGNDSIENVKTKSKDKECIPPENKDLFLPENKLKTVEHLQIIISKKSENFHLILRLR